MNISSLKPQSGFALLIFLVVLMGIGGLLLTGFSQQVIKEVENERLKHNREVLEEAKQALLMYVYRYPDFNAQGPGRLPCPYDQLNGYSGAVSAAICDAVGRFPRSNVDLNFELEAIDASGEYLWYAVSEEFRNVASSDLGANTNGDSVVNSESIGTISIFDQSGNLIFDGGTNGVAAVIIAPGFPLAGQDRNADPLDPANFLDSFNTFDNSAFVNGSNADADGFILGPIIDNNNTLVINDEFIVITTEEVVAMAEKATLQAYRDAINEYLANTGNVYPWLFDHDTDDLDNYSGSATLASVYPDGRLDTTGRIPSIFSNYFTEPPSERFESEVRLIVSKQFELTGSGQTFTISLDQQSALLLNVEFVDTGTPTDDVGELRADAGLYIYQKNMYLSETSTGSNSWLLCQNDAENLSDCNRDGLGAFTTGANNFFTRIIHVRVELDFTNNLQLSLTYPPTATTAPLITYTPAGSAPQHAEIKAEFIAANLTGLDASLDSRIYWELGTYDPGGFTSISSDNQPFEDNSDLPSTPVSGSLISLSTGNTTIGLRYYPEIPSWAHASENDWHNSILMAIDTTYQPGGPANCLTSLPCLIVDDIGGVTNDKVSLLVHASAAFDATDDGAAGYIDDLAEIFDAENANLDVTYLRRQGDDTVLVVR